MWEWEIDMRIQVPIVRWNLYLYPSVSISMVKNQPWAVVYISSTEWYNWVTLFMLPIALLGLPKRLVRRQKFLLKSSSISLLKKKGWHLHWSFRSCTSDFYGKKNKILARFLVSGPLFPVHPDLQIPNLAGSLELGTFTWTSFSCNKDREIRFHTVDIKAWWSPGIGFDT